MEKAGKILQKKYKPVLKRNNDINDNIDIANTVNNDNNGKNKKQGKYALDRTKFTPNTEEAQLAEEIATSFDDLQNYAFYFRVVKKLGASGALTFWKTHRQEEEENRGGRYEFRNSKQYFAWKFKRRIY